MVVLKVSFNEVILSLNQRTVLRSKGEVYNSKIFAMLRREEEANHTVTRGQANQAKFVSLPTSTASQEIRNYWGKNRKRLVRLFINFTHTNFSNNKWIDPFIKKWVFENKFQWSHGNNWLSKSFSEEKRVQLARPWKPPFKRALKKCKIPVRSQVRTSTFFTFWVLSEQKKLSLLCAFGSCPSCPFWTTFLRQTSERVQKIRALSLFTWDISPHPSQHTKSELDAVWIKTRQKGHFFVCSTRTVDQ